MILKWGELKPELKHLEAKGKKLFVEKKTLSPKIFAKFFLVWRIFFADPYITLNKWWSRINHDFQHEKEEKNLLTIAGLLLYVQEKLKQVIT